MSNTQECLLLNFTKKILGKVAYIGSKQNPQCEKFVRNTKLNWKLRLTKWREMQCEEKENLKFHYDCCEATTTTKYAKYKNA